MASNVTVGVVRTVTGEAFARSADGSMRRLVVGDPLYQGDVVVTANEGAVEVSPHNGSDFVVSEQSSVVVDLPGSVESLVPTEVGQASVAVNTPQNSVFDVLLEEEAAAAGLAAAEGGGHSFVDLARVAELVPGASYDFPINTTGRPPEIAGEAVPVEGIVVTGPDVPGGGDDGGGDDGGGDDGGGDGNYGWFIAQRGHANDGQYYVLDEGARGDKQSESTFNVQYQARADEHLGPLAAGESVTVVLTVAGSASPADFAIVTVNPSNEFAADWHYDPTEGELSVTLTNTTGREVNLQGNPFDVTVRAVADSVTDPGETLTFDILSTTHGTIWGSNDDVAYRIDDVSSDPAGANKDDLLIGTSGDDLMAGGGRGDDLLVGGAGDDQMSGDAGADTFAWTVDDLGSPGSPSHDVISDFDRTGGDRIDLAEVLESGGYSLSATSNSGVFTLNISDADNQLVQTIALETVAAVNDSEAEEVLKAMLSTQQILKTG